MSLRSQSKVKADFNISSLTDIIFLLLIFFILTSSVVKEPVLKVILPKSPEPTTHVDKQLIRISVNAAGTYAIDGKEVDFDHLPPELEKVLKKNPDATVSIWGDVTIPYGRVMELVRIADKQNAKVVLALKKE